MASSLDRGSSAAPLHRQLTRLLANQLRDGHFASGERLPSELGLADGYGVSRHVVRQALQQLVQQGLVRARHGSGYYVNSPRIRRHLPTLASFTKAMSKLGSVRTEALAQEIVNPPPAVAAELGTKPDEQAVFVRRLGFLDDEPVTLLEAHFPLSVGAALMDRNLSNLSLYQLLREEAGIVPTRAESVLSVDYTDAEEANLLGVPEGAGLLCLRSVTEDQDAEVFEVSRGCYRSDRFEFEIIKSEGGPTP